MAVDLPLNRYVEMAPDPANHEMWQTIYKVGAYVLAIAYVVAAVAANIFLGLTNPTFAPFAALSAILALPYAVDLFSSLNTLAQQQKDLAFQEQQIALKLERLPEADDEMRNVRARLEYWSERAETLRIQTQNILARQREDTPEGRALHRADQLEVLAKRQEACAAKVRAAYFQHVLRNQHYALDLPEAIPLVCMDPRNRMLERGLAAEFNEAAADTFVLRQDGTPLLSLQQVLSLPTPEAAEQAIFGTELPAAH